MQNQFRNSVPQGDHALSADKPKREWVKVLQGIALMPLMLGGFGIFNYIGEAMEGEPKDRQYACTAALDGSMSGFVRKVESSLRDPDSFEHIQSFATTVDHDGMQRVRMKFRARNGFGGVNVEMAEAVVQNAGCEIISWKMIG